MDKVVVLLVMIFKPMKNLVIIHYSRQLGIRFPETLDEV